MGEEERQYRFPNGFTVQLGRWNSYSSVSNNVNIGNHRLSTDGIILVNQSGEAEVLVDGKHAILQHSQHGLIQKEIPDGHLLALAPQRGRQLTVSGNMIYGAD